MWLKVAITLTGLPRIVNFCNHWRYWLLLFFVYIMYFVMVNNISIQCAFLTHKPPLVQATFAFITWRNRLWAKRSFLLSLCYFIVIRCAYDIMCVFYLWYCVSLAGISFILIRLQFHFLVVRRTEKVEQNQFNVTSTAHCIKL